jgi:hypothetical protein
VNTISEELGKLETKDLLILLTRHIKHKKCNYDLTASEQLLDFLSQHSEIDIRRSLQCTYIEIFRREEYLVVELSNLMNILKYEAKESDHYIFNDIEFFQQVVSTALWKYNLPIHEQLENFAREFDRIDDENMKIKILMKYSTNYKNLDNN